MDVGRGGLAPVSTGASSKEGAASTKEVSAREGSSKVRLGRRATNDSDSHGMGRFTRRRETRAVPGWCSWYIRRSGWTLWGGLRKARIGGIGNVLVPGRTERGEDFAVHGTGAIEGGVLAITVDAERRGGIAASYDRLLKASFRTALVSTSVGRAVIEESADRAGLCLFFAQRSRVTKTPALPALGGLGGRVGGSEHAGTGEKPDGFAEPGNMKSVDCHNNRGCALLGPFRRV